MEADRNDNRTDLSAVHGVLLEMLKTLAAFCEANGVRYFLYCGTLLGAIRHKGFIPWDDDVDIVMPFKDYKRFLKLASRDYPGGYEIETLQNNVNDSVPWIKIYKAGTTMLIRSQAAHEANWSISLDIYPMIGGPSSPRLSALQQKMIMAAKGLLWIDWHGATGNYGKRYVSLKKKILKIPRPVRWAAARFLLWLTMRPVEKSRRVGSIDAADFSLKYDKTWWDRAVKAEIEDTEFVISAEYDKVLTVMYGDYMTPPAEAKRYAHGEGAGDVIYDIHRDYREYRDELLKNKS